MGLSPKLTCKWQGPFTILECIGDVNYKVRLNPRQKPKIVHRDRIRPYFGPNPHSELPVMESDLDLCLDKLFYDDEVIVPVNGSAHSVHESSDIDGYDADNDEMQSRAPSPPPVALDGVLMGSQGLEIVKNDESVCKETTGDRRSKRERRPPARFGDWE